MRTVADRLGHNRPVVAKCCGRRTNGDMILDLSNIDVGTRRRWGLRVTELCDGCRERLFRERRVKRNVFYQAIAKKAPEKSH